MIQTRSTPFEVEYTSETPELNDAMKSKVEQRIQKLVERHRDVTGAALAVGVDGPGPSFRVRLVLYCRPENVAATHEGPSLQAVIREVLDAVERQVREQRERRRARSRRRPE
ncbi:MAG: HPF/RaiA family ribosome-associated protein [Rhodothermales bacterium]|nr:HPF/RaiA family ribosome-associated protein [Rhodothermales bacterium]